MKVAFVIGHNEKSKGAINELNGLREFDFYTEVMKEFSDYDVYKHDSSIKGYTTRMKATAKRINKKDYDLVILLHFNSFSSSAAHGCSTLYYGLNPEGKRLAHKFSDTVNKMTGVKLRHNGANALTNVRDRGFAMVYAPKATTILIEPFFGSNLEDCKKIDVCKIAEIIKSFLNEIN
jgi:N-acetylmuramoyl-L-alanine amidase